MLELTSETRQQDIVQPARKQLSMGKKQLTALGSWTLISTISTIFVPITEPAFWHTHIGVWALEGSWTTSGET